MNLLFLSNGAPNYFHFFNALSRRFLESGHTAVVAVDSSFTKKKNCLEDVGYAKLYDFEKFFSNHKTDIAILNRYSHRNLNSALLSDFERSEIYGIWGNSADTAFYDRLKSALLSFYEKIFDENRIQGVIHENVANSFSHFALFVAEQKGAKYYGLTGSRLPGRFAVTSDPLEDDATEGALRAIMSGDLVIAPEVDDWVASYIRNIESVTPDYMVINGLNNLGIIRRYARLSVLGKIKSLFRHVANNRTTAFQIGNPVRTYFNLFLRNVKRRSRSRLVRRYYQNPPSGEQYFLYPLHFHPEASTSILAGTYLNEYEVVRNIAFNLPEGTRLYVKDHMTAWAYPTLDFYRKLRALPNVRLLAPDANTKQLIKEASAVITLTSTVGYEALLLKTPVLLYGNVFYSFHTGVTRVQDPTKLYSLLSDCLAYPPNWGDDYNHAFVCAYYLTSLPGTLNLMQDAEGGKRLADQLFPEIEKAMVPKCVAVAKYS